MNGLTGGERVKLDSLRALVEHNLLQAKAEASAWVRANKRRSTLRRAACRTIKGLHIEVRS